MSEFDKIIGYEDIKAELSRFADILKKPDKYSKLGVTIPSDVSGDVKYHKREVPYGKFIK